MRKHSRTINIRYCLILFLSLISLSMISCSDTQTPYSNWRALSPPEWIQGRYATYPENDNGTLFPPYEPNINIELTADDIFIYETAETREDGSFRRNMEKFESIPFVVDVSLVQEDNGVTYTAKAKIRYKYNGSIYEKYIGYSFSRNGDTYIKAELIQDNQMPPLYLIPVKK